MSSLRLPASRDVRVPAAAHRTIAVLGTKGTPTVAGAGGVERGAFETVTRLAPRGFRFTVYGRGTQPAQAQLGVSVIGVPHAKGKYAAGWSQLAMAVARVVRCRRAIDVVHLHCAQFGAAAVVLRLLRKPVLFHVHGPEWSVTKWHPFVRPLYFLSALLGAQFATRTLTVCQQTRAALTRWLPWAKRRVSFLPNGVPDDLGGAAPARAPPRPFVLSVGRLVPQKNLHVLVRAFMGLEFDGDLFIAGAPSHSQEYADAIRRMSAGDARVRFLGHVSRDRLKVLYEDCQVLVQCSDSEGCSNVILEGLAAGCAMVASDIPQNRAVLGGAARFVAPRDVSALRSALATILSSADERGSLRRAATLRADALPTWTEVAEHMERVYADLVARDGGGADPASEAVGAAAEEDSIAPSRRVRALSAIDPADHARLCSRTR